MLKRVIKDKRVINTNHPYFKDMTGEVGFNKQQLRMEIIADRGCNDIDILFDNGYIACNKQRSHFKSGQIKNKLHPSVHGVGIEGVGKFSKETHPIIYDTWNSMLGRCYKKSCQKIRPTYKDKTVCIEWINLQNYGSWFEENYVLGFEIDKDILIKGNKIYSPETCCFVLLR